MRKIYGTRKTKDFSYLYIRNENIKKMASCTAFTTKKLINLIKKYLKNLSNKDLLIKQPLINKQTVSSFGVVGDIGKHLNMEQINGNVSLTSSIL